MKAVRNKVISHVVATVLGALGMWLGKDLSMFQKPAEAVIETATDKVEVAVEKQVEKKLEVKLGEPEIKVKVSVDAGPTK